MLFHYSINVKVMITYLFCSSNLANNSTSSGLSSAGDDGDTAGVECVVEEDVVCNETDGLATWLAI